MNPRNNGAVLPSALILLVSMTLIAVSVAYRSTLNELIGANQRDSVNAMMVAESGLESGFAYINGRLQKIYEGGVGEAFSRAIHYASSERSAGLENHVDSDRLGLDRHGQDLSGVVHIGNCELIRAGFNGWKTVRAVALRVDVLAAPVLK